MTIIKIDGGSNLLQEILANTHKALPIDLENCMHSFTVQKIAETIQAYLMRA